VVVVVVVVVVVAVVVVVKRAVLSDKTPTKLTTYNLIFKDVCLYLHPLVITCIVVRAVTRRYSDIPNSTSMFIPVQLKQQTELSRAKGNMSFMPHVVMYRRYPPDGVAAAMFETLLREERSVLNGNVT